jgi:uncharacterized protein (TIGR02145 family)
MGKHLLGTLLYLIAFQSLCQNTDTNNTIVYDVPAFELNQWYTENNDSVKDINGNYYHIIKLGNQFWLKENLRVTKYNNGDSIKFIKDDFAWYKTENDAYSIYISQYNDTVFYYNHYVVRNKINVCPCGWKVPDSSDWKILENYVNVVNSNFLKGRGTFYFDTDTLHLRKEIINVFETEIKGLSFSNQPYGYRSGITGEFLLYGDFGFWWVSSGENIASAWARIFNDRGFGIDDIHLSYFSYEKFDYGFVNNHGLTIRCIKDIK